MAASNSNKAGLLRCSSLHGGSPAIRHLNPQMSDMLLLFDYPSVQDLKEGRHVSGYPAALLAMAMRYAECTSVQMDTFLPEPPRFNNPSAFFHPKKNCPNDAVGNPIHHKWGHLRSDLMPHLQRIRQRCKEAPLVLALGDLSLWALTGDKLSDHRGTILYAEGGLRVIGSHNPRSIIKDQSLLPVLSMDLKKAWQESLKPRSVFPRRTMHIIESLADMRRATQRILGGTQFAFDIETAQQQVTMICFAPSPHEVYVLPFWFHTHNFWDEDTELQMWLEVQRLMASPLRKVAHNAVYDLTYLMEMGLRIRFPVDDTMLKSHSNEIEWLKSLGFLGSIYCNEKSWKNMRVGKVKDRNKKDE